MSIERGAELQRSATEPQSELEDPEEKSGHLQTTQREGIPLSHRWPRWWILIAASYGCWMGDFIILIQMKHGRSYNKLGWISRNVFVFRLFLKQRSFLIRVSSYGNDSIIAWMIKKWHSSRYCFSRTARVQDVSTQKCASSSLMLKTLSAMAGCLNCRRKDWINILCLRK